MRGASVRIASLLGSSQAMNRVRAFARTAARAEVPVLILGETGTGKSLLARAIHFESARAEGPFQAFNCAGIPDTLFESEVFGYEKGAFTGAFARRRGVLEQAQRGSVLFDEVGELSVGQQAKLLTALEEGEIRRLGGEGVVGVDVRILAATARDLHGEMREGGFRRDLFHRLAVLTCRLPPLRSRKEDIAPLARRVLDTHQRRHGHPREPLSKETLSCLESLPWPGNIRELSHLLEAALLLSDGAGVDPGSLRAARAMVEGEPPGHRPSQRQAGSATTDRYAFGGTEMEEKEEIRRTMDRCRGNKSRAARELGMSRNTLRHKLKKYALD